MKRNGKGLADEGKGQYIKSFLSMAKKQLIVMMRYPISFVSGFGQIFLIFMVFFLATVMFVPEPVAEWSDANSMDVHGGTFWAGTNDTSLLFGYSPSGTQGRMTLMWSGNGTGGIVWNITGKSTIQTNDDRPLAISDSLIEFSIPNGILDNGSLMVYIYTTDWIYPAGSNITDPSTWALLSTNDSANSTLLLDRISHVSIDGTVGEFSEGEDELGSMVVYGLILFLFLSEALWTIGHSIRDEQYQGTIESLYLTPASKFTNLVSRVFPTLTWTGAIAIMMILILSLFKGELPTGDLGIAILVLLFTLSGTFGIGFAFAAIALRIKESVQLLINISQFGLMLLSAMMYPFSVLPDWVVDYGSRWIPLSYSVDAFRSAMLGRTPELLPMGTEIIIIIIFGIVMPFAGYFLFKWQENAVRKKGTLSEY